MYNNNYHTKKVILDKTGVKKKARSGLESKVASWLNSDKIEFEYETLQIPYVIEKTYTPDFVCGTIVIEAKGRFMPEDRRKHLCVKKQYPELDIRFMFERDQYLNHKTKGYRYSDWCTKHGFKYHIGERLPKAWRKEIRQKIKKIKKKSSQ